MAKRDIKTRLKNRDLNGLSLSNISFKKVFDYEELQSLIVPDGEMYIVLVEQDAINNSGRTTEYHKYSDGTTMLQASVNLNDL